MGLLYHHTGLAQPIKNNAIKLLPIYDATLSERAEASQLIIDALPEFYEIFGNKKNVLLAIADLLGDPNSDISSGVMALGGNCVAAIYT